MQDADKHPVTLTGELEWMGMEGGFWTLLADGKVYDLHADRDLLSGFKSGDKVQVQGTLRPDLPCFHMRGIIVEVESISRCDQE